MLSHTIRLCMAPHAAPSVAHLFTSRISSDANHHTRGISSILLAHIAGGWAQLQRIVCHSRVRNPAAAHALQAQGNLGAAADAAHRRSGISRSTAQAQQGCRWGAAARCCMAAGLDACRRRIASHAACATLKRLLRNTADGGPEVQGNSCTGCPGAVQLHLPAGGMDCALQL